MPVDARHNSRIILEGPDRAPARAMMKAVGFTDQDLARPQIGRKLAPAVAAAGSRRRCRPSDLQSEGKGRNLRELSRPSGPSLRDRDVVHSVYPSGCHWLELWLTGGHC